MVQVHNLQVNSRTTPTPPPSALDFFVHFNHHQNNKHRALQCGLNYGKNSAKKLTFFQVPIIWVFEATLYLRLRICIYKTCLKLNLFFDESTVQFLKKKICSHVLKEVEIESQLTHIYSMLKRFILIKNMNLSGILDLLDIWSLIRHSGEKFDLNSLFITSVINLSRRWQAIPWTWITTAILWVINI